MTNNIKHTSDNKDYGYNVADPVQARDYTDAQLIAELKRAYSNAASASATRIVKIAALYKRGYDKAAVYAKIRIAVDSNATGKSLFYREYATAAAAQDYAMKRGGSGAVVTATFLIDNAINAAAYVATHKNATAAAKIADRISDTAADIVARGGDSATAAKYRDTAADITAKAATAIKFCRKADAIALVATAKESYAAAIATADALRQKSTRIESDTATADATATATDLSRIPTEELIAELERRGIVIDAATATASAAAAE